MIEIINKLLHELYLLVMEPPLSDDEILKKLF